MEKKIIPPRRNTKPAKMCEDFAISLFDTAAKAKIVFKELPSNIKALLGYTHLSKTDLAKDDGVMSDIDEKGHFNFHEYANSAFLKRCRIIDDLA
ncbi:hypothetical protein [Pontibacter russatus]|uniref:hypothetical protein n=1 Tax=Pontibacter russatus TaxID=2694929 RepID=UPI00137B06B6|nr:hypothetical protein [Pontibacter russatus]